MTTPKPSARPASLPGPKADPRRGRRFSPPSLDQLEGRIVLSASPTAGITLISAQTVGEQELVTVANNNTSGSVKVTVADYSYTNNILQQQLVGSKTISLKAGDTRTISVDLACNANNQFDVLVDQSPRSDANYFFDPNYLGGGQTGFITCTDNDKVHGNEGLGNGVDPPPPGHAGDAQQNDDPGHGPGDPNKGFNKS